MTWLGILLLLLLALAALAGVGSLVLLVFLIRSVSRHVEREWANDQKFIYLKSRNGEK